MRKIILIFISNLVIAQSNYEKLAQDFIEINLPYESTKEYFPKINFDTFNQKVITDAGENLKEVTSSFKTNFEWYYENSRYFAVGKIGYKNIKGLLYYEVQKSTKDGSLNGTYEMIIFDKNNELIIHKYLAGYTLDKNDAYQFERKHYAKIYIENYNLVVEETDEVLDQEKANKAWKTINKEIIKTAYAIDQKGLEHPVKK
uniref:hypothetical protein n=1 Tax=Flavobacterium sp. TaxID=239 RepID=UPI004049F424